MAENKQKKKGNKSEVPIEKPGSWRGDLPGRDPLLGLKTIRNTMNQLVADIFYQTEKTPFEVPYQPRIDMYRKDNNLYVEIELPGIDKDNISIHATSDLLIIQGSTVIDNLDKREQHFIRERFSGSFSRSVPLPYKVETDRITAKLEKGVLVVKIPIKPQKPSTSKKIEIE